MNGLIKDTILEKYGSVNNFIEKHIHELGLSRTHIYVLLDYKTKNPGIKTLEKIANILGLKVEDVYNDYLARYRDEGTEN